ncbi:MAG: hypothetical protein ACTSXX_10495 [Candidatus Baldrarchaeia archaeon]
MEEAFSALPWRSVIDKRRRRVLYKEITARVRGLERGKLFAPHEVGEGTPVFVAGMTVGGRGDARGARAAFRSPRDFSQV